ncbi:MAG TPA: glycosyltransferase, partial [Armatimonadota bacterium]|nr:glycosyltransferase [Armatimonadota bacterium]
PLNIIHNIAAVGRGSFGLGPVALNLAKGQLSSGADARIWCLETPDEVQWASHSSGFPADRIHAFPHSGPSFLGYTPAMEHAICEVQNGAVVLHQHGIWTGLSRVTNVWRSKGCGPTVVTPHGSLEPFALQRSRWKKRLALLAYERCNLHGASCLHACSLPEVAGFRQFGLNNPVAVIPNGIPTEWLASDGNASAFRAKFPQLRDKRIILYLGRISPGKGLPILVEALSLLREQLDEWVLVIAGVEEFGHQADVQAVIDQLGMQEHIIFVGPLFDQDKHNAFASADLFTLPTYRENFAVVVAEALGTGVPVITTKGAPWEDLITHHCGWWTDISAMGIAEALRDALQRPRAELQAMGRRGKELVANNYTWKRSAEMTRELYQWLLGRGKRPEFVITE